MRSLGFRSSLATVVVAVAVVVALSSPAATATPFNPAVAWRASAPASAGGIERLASAPALSLHISPVQEKVSTVQTGVPRPISTSEAVALPRSGQLVTWGYIPIKIHIGRADE